MTTTQDPTGPSVGFDATDPPRPELIADCVHCGMCLSSCPTYVLWGNEMDSPRGRIYQMKLISERAGALDATSAAHFDSCLGCVACMTACPSGVDYGHLIEAVRPQIERNVPRQPNDRRLRSAIFAVFPYRARVRLAMLGAFVYQKTPARWLAARLGILKFLPPSLRTLEALCPPLTWRTLVTRTPTEMLASRTARRTVALVTGCVQEAIYPHVNAATMRVMSAEGCHVIAPRAQSCCGALSQHAGRSEEARNFARRMVDRFAPLNVDHIVVNVAGCGSMLKDYGHVLQDDPAYADKAATFAAKVCDISELLAELEPLAKRHPIPGRIAMHDACHLLHGQGIRSQPRQVLGQIPELELVELAEPEMCCGSAGIYNIVQPLAAEALGRRKATSVDQSGADALVAANPGCLLQIRRYLERSLPVFHPVEIVDASIRNIQPFAPTTRTEETT